jgi:hypothetical protein
MNRVARLVRRIDSGLRDSGRWIVRLPECMVDREAIRLRWEAKKRPKGPREVATHSRRDVGTESPSEMARLEELDSTTRRLERENIRLKSEIATLSVDAFIGTGA